LDDFLSEKKIIITKDRDDPGDTSSEPEFDPSDFGLDY
jgi:hypothetical protein